mgnify:CR=1 FL=1
MKNVRRIVGSVHETTLAKSRVVLYLQHFPKAYVSEIGTYQNVEVVDVVVCPQFPPTVAFTTLPM